MSYCRWSSDDFSCDIYCYESEVGYMVHVASQRVVGDVPKLTSWSHENTDEYFQNYYKQMEFMETAEYGPINLPCDGETFCFDTAADCAFKLIELKDMGYNVPQHAIDSLMEEYLESK